MFTKLSRETKKWIAYLLMATIIVSDAGIAEGSIISGASFNASNIVEEECITEEVVTEEYSSDDTEVYDDGIVVYSDETANFSETTDSDFIVDEIVESEDTNITEEISETVGDNAEQFYSDDYNNENNPNEENEITPDRNLVKEIFEIIETGARNVVNFIKGYSDDDLDFPLNKGVSENTVSFNANGHGVAPTAITVSADEIISDPGAPTGVEGYNFGGWYKDSGCTAKWDFDNDKVTEDITLFAKWTIKEFTVAFNLDGGEGTIDSQTVSYNCLAKDPGKDPGKIGHKFIGWTLGGEIYDFDTPVKSDITLTAKWEKNKYTVTFVSEHGTVDPASAIVEYEGSVTKPDVKGVDKTYELAGWYKDSEFTNEWNFTTDKVTNSITLYAKWTEIAKYTISCNSVEHGSISADYDEAIAGTKITVTGVPSEAGYYLEYVKYEEGKNIPAKDNKAEFIMPAKNITITAKFVKKYSVSVSKDIKNATVETDVKEQSAGGLVHITATPEVGYYVKTVSYNVVNSIRTTGMPSNVEKGATIEIPDFVMPEEDVVITANAEKIIYKIDSETNDKATVNVVGGKTDANYGDEIEFSVKAVSGNIISKVEVKNTRTGKNVAVSGPVGDIYKFNMPAANVKITANAGTLQTLKETVSGNGSIDIYAPKTGEKIAGGTPVKVKTTPDDGYRVKKIYIKYDGKIEDCSKIGENEYEFEMPEYPAEIVVEYEKIVYFKVTFDANGHGVAPAAYEKVISGNTIEKPADPTETGYTFGGWYKNSDCEDKDAWNFSTDIVTDNTTLYAKWTKLSAEYTVKFDLDGGNLPVPEDQKIKAGEKATKPTSNPTKENAVFKHWSKSKNGAEYDFNTAVTEDFTLFAVWEETKTFKVKVNREAYDYDSTAKYPLEGAILQVYSGTKQIGGDIETNGTDYVIDLPAGKYELRESVTPYSYKSASKVQFSVDEEGNVTVKSEKVDVVILVSGRANTSVEFKKIDNFNDYVLGADILLFKEPDVTVEEDETGKYRKATYKESNAVFSIIDSGNNGYNIPLLEYNKNYVIVEKNTPSGYETACPILFRIEPDMVNSTDIVYMWDYEYGNKPYDFDYIPTPSYYMVATDEGNIEMVDYTASVTLYKVDDEGYAVEGAKIKLSLYDVKKGKQGFVDEFVTDGYATVIKPLARNQAYILEETSAPNGYDKCKPVIFRVNDDDMVELYDGEWSGDAGTTYDSIIMVDERNNVKANINIGMLDYDSFDDLLDTELTVVSADGETISIAGEDSWWSNGGTQSVSLMFQKEYELTMITTPLGYTTVDEIGETIRFKVGSDGKAYLEDEDYEYTEKVDCVYMYAQLDKDDLDDLVCANINKYDGSGRHLAGAELEIYDYDDGEMVNGEWIMGSYATPVTLFTVDETPEDFPNPFISTGKTMPVYGLYPQHKYVLYENAAPAMYEAAKPVVFKTGYRTNEDPEVEKGTPKVTMIDKISSSQSTSVKIRKIASNTKNWLKNAVLYVYPMANTLNVNDESSYTAKIITNGTDQTIQVNYNTYYILHEVLAPTGYSIAPDITFCVKEDGVYESKIINHVFTDVYVPGGVITMTDMYAPSSSSSKDKDKDKDSSSSSSSENNGSNVTVGAPLVTPGTNSSAGSALPGTNSSAGATLPASGVVPTTINIGGANVVVDPASFYKTVEYLAANQNIVPANVKNLVDAYIDKILEVNPTFFDNASAAVKGYVLGRRRGKLPQTGGFVGTPTMYLLALLMLLLGLWLAVDNKKKLS